MKDMLKVSNFCPVNDHGGHDHFRRLAMSLWFYALTLFLSLGYENLVGWVGCPLCLLASYGIVITIWDNINSF